MAQMKNQGGHLHRTTEPAMNRDQIYQLPQSASLEYSIQAWSPYLRKGAIQVLRNADGGGGV